MNLDLGYTKLIIDEAQKNGVLRNQLAYILATAYHETARTMKPVRETLASSDQSAIRILEKSWKAGKMPWVKTAYWRTDADDKSWLGRGFVQLTWKKNYEKAEKELKVKFTSDPTLAMVPENAARVLVLGMIEGWFTGKKLSDYITLKASDFLNARYIINGKDKREAIAEYAKQYDAALLSYKYGVTNGTKAKVGKSS